MRAARAPRRSPSAPRSTPRTGASRSAAPPTPRPRSCRAASSSAGASPIRQSRIKQALQEAHHRAAAHRLLVQEGLPARKASISAKRRALEEARPAPVRRRQGLVPHQRAQRRGDRPRHALERPGPLRRHAGDGPARPRRGPRQGQAQDGHRADRAHLPRPAPLSRRIHWPPRMGKVVKLEKGAAKPRPLRALAPSRAPRWCWAAAASPAGSMRSARCARSTCCRSTAASTSSTSTSAPAPAR